MTCRTARRCCRPTGDYRNPVKRKVLLYGTCADGNHLG